MGTLARRRWQQGKRQRNTVLALDALAEVAEVGSSESLTKTHGEWIEDALISEAWQRDGAWTKSVAVGSRKFVLETRKVLGAHGKGREVVGAGMHFCFGKRKMPMALISTPKIEP